MAGPTSPWEVRPDGLGHTSAPVDRPTQTRAVMAMLARLPADQVPELAAMLCAPVRTARFCVRCGCRLTGIPLRCGRCKKRVR